MTYSLRSLLLAFVVIASALGTFGPCGLPVGLLIVAGVALSRTVRDTSLQCVILLIMGGFVLSVILLPAFQAAKEAARRAQCANNLKQIALALLSYQEEHGTFPPARVLGPDGTPWHSWRVLLLPYIGEQALYAAYNFNEPWNGPANRRLAASVPWIYVCPLSDTWRTRSGATSYFAVVGSKTAWPGTTARQMREISDARHRTILATEAAGLGIPWMEPRDLDFERVVGQSAPDPKVIGDIAHPCDPRLFFISEGGTLNVAFADGSVRSIPWGVAGSAIEPLLTAQGGEKIDLNGLAFRDSPRPNWPRVLSLASLVLSTLLLWWTTRPGRRRYREPENPSADAAPAVAISPPEAPGREYDAK